MMEKVGNCAKYMCMVAPKQMKCMPILAGANPRTSYPTIPTADRILVRSVVEDIILREVLTRMVLTQVSMIVPG